MPVRRRLAALVALVGIALASAGSPAAHATVGAEVARVAGADRIATAVAVSQASYPNGGAASVVLARSDVFADALAGTPLAVAKNGPLLLTEPAALNATTSAEIRRVATAGSTVYLLGGTAALSASVEASVRALGHPVERYAGAERFETAVRIASAGLNNPATLFLASGLDFPDALAGGAAAARVQGGGAVLLTNGAVQAPATQAYLNGLGPRGAGTEVFALGGPAARASGPGAIPIVGADRYDTAARLAATEQIFGAGPTAFGAASGVTFPDALAGGAHIARLGGPLLLVQPTAVPPVVRDFLERRANTLARGFVYGGSAAISEPVRVTLQESVTLLRTP